MPRRIVLSLAVAIAALLLGLVLAFLSRGSTPQPQPEPQPQEEPIPPAQPVENPLPNEPEEPQNPAGYLLRDYEGRLAIFREESNTPEMIFDVYTRLLPQADQETVEVDGVTYRKRDDLTVILAMGVDHETQDEYEYRKAGQADFLRLIVLDNKKKTVQQLQIDRDTITPVTMLGVLGDRYEPVTQQICLGYAFGDGRQSSCEVTVEAVENLLGGQKIDQYLSMGLDGISTLNDLAGGVTVTLEDDFSAIDPAMTKGTTLTLWGDQAEVYVRTRRSIGVGTNEARMVRQEQYIRQITGQLDEKVRQDQNFVLTAYDALEPYLYTNIPRGQLANEAWAAKDYERLETIKPEGTYQVGDDGFMEFYPDAASLQQAVLQLFYEKA